MASSTTVPHVVSGAQLQALLGRSDVKVLDSSWHMPNSGRSGRADFLEARIQGAQFFDLDGVKDASSALPHMLPPPTAFAAAADALGIEANTHVVVYDTHGCFSAPRAWYTFRALGHNRVSVLDGGLPLWQAEGRPVEHGETASPVDAATVACATAQTSTALEAALKYPARLNSSLVKSLNDVMMSVVERKQARLVDARPAGRFEGTVPEPRPGLRGGHIPGSRSLPFSQVLKSNGTLKSVEELKAVFDAAGAPLDDIAHPLWASCGTGVTACIVALAAAVAGRDDVAVYDGSWTEWGAPDAATPVTTGPAAQ
jgi:thiosulfate/3-mercaptopyruvate sulfurtransferase